MIKLLLTKGGRVIAPVDSLMELFVSKLRDDSHEFFELLYHMEFKDTIKTIENSERRTAAHLSVLLQAPKCVEVLKTKFKFAFAKKDIYQMSGLDYAVKNGNR